jgi:hypothetical protein
VIWDYSSDESGESFVYVDGVNDSSSSSNYLARNENNSSDTFKIGLPNNNEALNYFDGEIDDVRIWNTALTESEIQANMNLQLSGNENNLVACYNFENGDAIDVTDNAYHGTLNNNIEMSDRGISVFSSGRDEINGILPGNGTFYILDSDPKFGTLTLDNNTGQFTYIPENPYEDQTDSFGYFASDSEGNYSYREEVSFNYSKSWTFELTIVNAGTEILYTDQQRELLEFTVTHDGTIDDPDMELTTLELIFENSSSEPLTTDEANAMFAYLHIYLDDGSGAFEKGPDTLVTSVDTFSLTNGIQTINFEDGDSNVWVSYGTPETFFVVIESRDELDETNPTQFRIGHLSDAGTRAEDSETDIEIALVAIDDTYSDIVTLTEFEETISRSALFMDAYKHQIADASQSYGMDAADIDKDGDMDVVISSYDLQKVLWYENDGFQTFTEHTLLENFSDPIPVYAIDLNQDSYTDFIALSLDGELSWLKNDGTENFTEFFISELTNRPFEIYPSDMDGDNDIVIVLIRLMTYDNIFWYENDGNGNFTEYSLNENFFKGHSIHAADIDGDGDNDIVATSDKEVAWFENEGFNSFTKHTLFESTGYDDDLYAAYMLYTLLILMEMKI